MAAQYDILRELVRTSKLQATIDQNLTIHTRPFGRRRRETWTREQILGHGGYGVVWLERKVKEGGSPAELRAVKSIRISDHRTKPDGGQYVRELEALVMFSQDKVRRSVSAFLRHPLQTLGSRRVGVWLIGVSPAASTRNSSSSRTAGTRAPDGSTSPWSIASTETSRDT